jgi:hypothetical protein
MMKKPESHEPTNTANPAYQWRILPSRRSPVEKQPE